MLILNILHTHTSREDIPLTHTAGSCKNGDHVAVLVLCLKSLIYICVQCALTQVVCNSERIDLLSTKAILDIYVGDCTCVDICRPPDVASLVLIFL